MALAAVLTLGACRATGGGYIDKPAPGVPGVVFDGEAEFGFNFTCDMATDKKSAVIRGTITYHDDPSTFPLKTFPNGIKLHGQVDPKFIDIANYPGLVLPPGGTLTDCMDAAELGLSPFDPNGTASFQGDYWSQDTTFPETMREGRFRVEVVDFGEGGFSDGDYFDIRLLTGPYTGYNRAGYVEGGNIQVDNT
jgi:hypothetical protein